MLVRTDHPEIDENDLRMFETAIVEIHGNVVEHGHPPGRVIYAFELGVRPDRLVRHPRRHGQRDAGPHRLDELPDELAESGRGLWLAKATLDELEYVPDG